MEVEEGTVGGEDGREGQLSHFVSQVGAFHAALESCHPGPAKTGGECKSMGLLLSDDSTLGPELVPRCPPSLLYSNPWWVH